MSDVSIPVVFARGMPVLTRENRFMLAGVPMLAAIFLGVGWWNGFPLMFYDTGAYLAEGLSGAFLVERSPVYSLLLFFTGGGFSLWPVVILQSLMTAYFITLLARIEAPRLSLAGLVAIGAALMALTGIGWYVGQVEPDCMTPLVLIGSYLLLFRNASLSRIARGLVIAITALAVASHPSHLGLIAGLLLVGLALRLFVFLWPHLPRPDLKLASVTLAIAVALILASNFA